MKSINILIRLGPCFRGSHLCKKLINLFTAPVYIKNEKLTVSKA